MESRRRSGRASGNLGIDRLIVIVIRALLFDIWRQRHRSELIQDFEENTLIMEFHMTDSFREHLDASAGQFAFAKRADRAFFDRMGIATEALPNVPLLLMEEQDLDLAFRVFLDPNEAGGNHFGVIANQNITGIQIIDDVMEMLMLNRLFFAIDHQETAIIAFGHRALGNQLFRELKIK